MSSGKKVCLNSPSSYYTGREQSPLHYGLSAEGYEVNAIMEGYDKELWIVEVRNNKKVWTKKEYINKMTYECPLIKEVADTSKDTDVAMNVADVTNVTDVTNVESSASKACEAKDTAVTAVTEVTEVTAVAPKATKAATKAVKAAKSAKAAKATTKEDDVTATTATTVAVAEPVSKIMKPTDYTLFITYRIHQMKAESGDNRKNYDSAREEWKEYKKKPDELKAIMIEASNFNCAIK